MFHLSDAQVKDMLKDAELKRFRDLMLLRKETGKFWIRVKKKVKI